MVMVVVGRGQRQMHAGHTQSLFRPIVVTFWGGRRSWARRCSLCALLPPPRLSSQHRRWGRWESCRLVPAVSARRTAAPAQGIGGTPPAALATVLSLRRKAFLEDAWRRRRPLRRTLTCSACSALACCCHELKLYLQAVSLVTNRIWLESHECSAHAMASVNLQ